MAIIGAGRAVWLRPTFLPARSTSSCSRRESKIGGHCDSHVIDYKGKRVTVDLGAQFFHPDTHPIYVTLLEELGLYDPAHPGADDTLQAPGSLCIFPRPRARRSFRRHTRSQRSQRSIEFASYAQLARHAVLSNMPWETTVDAWVRSLPVSQSFKNDVAYPWIMALIGCSRAAALRASARSILQTFALSFPADIVQGATTYNSTIGLQGNLQRLLDRSPRVRVRLSTATQALTHNAPVGSWRRRRAGTGLTALSC